MVFLVAIFFGCDATKKTEIILPEGKREFADGFAFYFPKDTSIKIYDLRLMDLDKVMFEEKPWLSDSDIEFFDLSNCCLYLKENKGKFIPEYKYPYKLPASWEDRPFVITLDKKIICCGYFVTKPYSYYPWAAYNISVSNVDNYPDDVIHLDWSLDSSDPFGDSEIKKMISGRKYCRNSVSFILDSIFITNRNPTEFKIYYSIYNNTKNNLYIPDMEKMDENLYRYFNAAPFFSYYNLTLYSSSLNYEKYAPNPVNKADKAWYSCVKPDAPIQRVIKAEGYPEMPEGNYGFKFFFGSPTKVEKIDRITADGEYWIGKFFHWMNYHIIISDSIKCKIQWFM